MRLLLEKRGDEVKITEEVVKAAATSGQEEILLLFEEQGSLHDCWEQWLPIAHLYNAAKAGDEETIRRLLAQGINPDLKNPRNVSPLWMAAAHGNSSVVGLLLDTEAVDINSRSISGRSPIFWAAAGGYEDVVELLLERGANPDIADEDGQTPLSMARKYGHKKVLDMLKHG